MADNQKDAGMADTVVQPTSQSPKNGNDDAGNHNGGGDTAETGDGNNNGNTESAKESAATDAETIRAAAVRAAEEADAQKLTSLLDYRLEEDHASFSRIVVACRLAVGESEESASQKLPPAFKTLVKDFRMPVSGLAMLQAEVFLAAFECFPDDLCTLVRRVSALPIISELKVLVNSEDCPHRCFMPLSFHRPKLVKEGDVDLDGEFGDAATAGFSLYERLLNVGKAMRKANRSDTVPSHVTNNLPSNSRVLAYLKDDGFFSGEQFIEVFDDPTHEVPLLDRVWPHQGEVPLV